MFIASVPFAVSPSYCHQCCETRQSSIDITSNRLDSAQQLNKHFSKKILILDKEDLHGSVLKVVIFIKSYCIIHLKSEKLSTKSGKI